MSATRRYSVQAVQSVRTRFEVDSQDELVLRRLRRFVEEGDVASARRLLAILPRDEAYDPWRIAVEPPRIVDGPAVDVTGLVESFRTDIAADGAFVAIVDGSIVDSDHDYRALVARLRSRGLRARALIRGG